LPEVTLTGITTILGDKRALLKVRFPAKQSDVAREESFILKEGKRSGPITVLEVNEKVGTVRVDNSGTIMVVTFEKPSIKPPSAPPQKASWPRLPYPRGSR
jgi:hypothetical protein